MSELKMNNDGKKLGNE